ncbi:D-alanyl-D-alanine carboxypeptidase family protein [Aquilutibacter rugosus]|uniref:D-alanyl-D-alanine carboxypeptidase family protein n=1 Tax=Aquilutibacter rugosus TaxID=3115820 RepID=UPI002F3F55CE
MIKNRFTSRPWQVTLAAAATVVVGAAVAQNAAPPQAASAAQPAAQEIPVPDTLKPQNATPAATSPQAGGAAATAATSTVAPATAAAQTQATAPTAPTAIAAPPVVTGKAWVILDAGSGRILAGQNYNAKLEPASITKVMTSYVIAAEMAAGRVKANDQVTMTEEAWREGGAGTDGSYSGFPVNQSAPLVEMEKGMVVQSGNDAAIALAQHVAGTTAAFADLMNHYAGKIGMKNSHFANPTGLPDPNHYSTAYDLALLGRALAKDFPTAYSYNSIKEFTVGPITQQNRNLLLWRDSTVDGIKTGHTGSAGYCLMASAKRADMRLVSVILGSDSMEHRASDSLALLNWGFRFFESNTLFPANKPLQTTRVWKGSITDLPVGTLQPVSVVVPRGQGADLKAVIDVQKAIVAPLKKGQVVGTVKVMQGDKVVSTEPLVALADVAEGGFFRRLWDSLLMLFK